MRRAEGYSYYPMGFLPFPASQSNVLLGVRFPFSLSTYGWVRASLLTKRSPCALAVEGA